MVKKHILDLENFKHILTAFGDKLIEDEMDDIFSEFEFDDDGNVFTKVGWKNLRNQNIKNV